MNLPALIQIGGFGLADLVVAIVIIGSAVTSLRRRSGVLGTVGAVLGTALVCWLALVAVAVWAPADIAQLARSSRVLSIVPPPMEAIRQLQQLITSRAG